MAIRSAREVLPPEVEIVLDRHLVGLPAPKGALACEATGVRGAARRGGPDGRVGPTGHAEQALAIPRRGGGYLEGDTSPWAHDRRGQLEELVEGGATGRIGGYELGAYRDAERLVRDGLARNPFRESGWRLLMRVAAASPTTATA